MSGVCFETSPQVHLRGHTHCLRLDFMLTSVSERRGRTADFLLCQASTSLAEANRHALQNHHEDVLSEALDAVWPPTPVDENGDYLTGHTSNKILGVAE